MRKAKVIPGRLIVFEGPDGVGKSTISAKVTSYLRRKDHASELLSFPGKEAGTLGRLVYELHHDPGQYGIKELTSASQQVLHIAAHLDAIEREIKPSLQRGKNVLLDRYWWSTWVYGAVSGINRRVLKQMIELERIYWGPHRPTAVFLLCRAQPVDREDDLDVWRQLAQEYERLADEEKRNHPVFPIDNSGTLAETVQRIIGILDNELLLPPETDPGNDRAAGAKQLSIGFEAPSSDLDAGPLILTHLLPAKPTVVFNSYWRFAAERQRIFFRRLFGEPSPWTTDPILAQYKFTNAYRASDRVSQYLIRHVIYREDLPASIPEVFFRILLFKVFNKIETWKLLEEQLGPLTFEAYSFEVYDRALTEALAVGRPIYSAAYIMPSGTVLGHVKKHRNHLQLVEQMMGDDLPRKLADAPNMHRGFDLLRAYPTIGDFLAYQFITDVNYSEITHFSEMEFVIPGPGARDGIRKCFRDLGGLNEPEIIRFMADIQEAEFDRLDLHFPSLWGRRLQLIDCQNLFCEVDKYARVKHPEVAGISGRTKIKQRYTPTNTPISFWYPPKWGINEAIACSSHEAFPLFHISKPREESPDAT